VDAVAIIDSKVAFAANANDVTLEEAEWAGVFDIDEGIELGWEEAEVLDFWTVEIFAHLVGWEIFVEPVFRRQIFWFDFVGRARDYLVISFRHGATNNLTILFDCIHEAQTVACVIAEI
jgi:hypothetical protein